MDRGVVMGRFRVRERIGAGGMGVVYRAFDERLQRDVALKEITGADPERVLREAQAAARLNHPGIVTVYELGRRGESAVLVSELVAGATLAELRSRGSISDRDVAEIGIDVCEALAHAHRSGVVHRDLKPQNVIVCEDEGAGRRAKLMDFGIALLDGAATLTATGEVLGTLAYMAPEQCDGSGAGPAADVYSLALTLYECWTGSNPVAGPTPAATARRIGEPVASLSTVRPDLDSGLAEAIDASLATRPEDRPPVEALGAELHAGAARLDSERPVPGRASLEERAPGPSVAGRVAAPLALAATTALLAGPAGAPGAALVLAVLGLPAALALPGLRAVVPAAGAVLAGAGAAGAYPAAAAHAGRRAAQRALAGALGWLWTLALAAGLGLGSGLGLVTRAPAGWETSPAAATAEVLAPMLEPAALAGAAMFAVAAVVLGWVLSARHVSLAALGTLGWAAGLAAGAGSIADGSIAGRPAVIALAGAAALAFEHLRRSGLEQRPGALLGRQAAARGRPERSPIADAELGTTS